MRRRRQAGMVETSASTSTLPQRLFDPFGATASQRWRERRDAWRAREDLIDTARLEVLEVAEGVAKAFVCRHHYSGSCPAARLRYGLVDQAQERLLRVCVLGVPMQDAVLRNVFPDLERNEAAELSRLVPLDDAVVGANAESFFVARAFRAAAERGLRGVVAFSDPVPRRRADRRMVQPGHIGIVYQGLNAAYLGRSSTRSILLLPDATVLSARAISKVARLERDHDYVERRLVALGAPPRGGREPRAWLKGALQAVDARRFRHPGNFCYAWAIGDRSSRRRVCIAVDPLAYPKRIGAGLLSA